MIALADIILVNANSVNRSKGFFVARIQRDQFVDEGGIRLTTSCPSLSLASLAIGCNTPKISPSVRQCFILRFAGELSMIDLALNLHVAMARPQSEKSYLAISEWFVSEA